MLASSRECLLAGTEGTASLDADQPGSAPASGVNVSGAAGMRRRVPLSPAVVSMSAPCRIIMSATEASQRSSPSGAIRGS